MTGPEPAVSAAAIASLLGARSEAVIFAEGQGRFVVMDVARYRFLRECEREALLARSEADVAAGRFVVESVPQHMARLERMLVEGQGDASIP